MEVFRPTSLAEVHDILGERPAARLLAGGTDLLVDLRTGGLRPPAVVFVGEIVALQEWRRRDGLVDLGAAVTLNELTGPELSRYLPALAVAARAIAGPQIRNAATIGGNIVTAMPTSDLIPVLAALDATAEVEGIGGRRKLPIGSSVDVLAPDEVLVTVRVPLRRGTQVYLRAGSRNGMALLIVAVAVAVDLDERAVRCAIGGCGAAGLRAPEAERWAADQIDWLSGQVPDPRTFETFGGLVADASRPIGDGRASAAYRRHAVGVLARRALMMACG